MKHSPQENNYLNKAQYDDFLAEIDQLEKNNDDESNKENEAENPFSAYDNDEKNSPENDQSTAISQRTSTNSRSASPSETIQGIPAIMPPGLPNSPSPEPIMKNDNSKDSSEELVEPPGLANSADPPGP
eukprot:UN21741